MSYKSFNGLLPKTSTQALNFLEQNPTWDGRGVVIAILDTGVDPGAIGLQTTPDGSPKILDLQDCTGAGDVDMKRKCTVSLDINSGKEFITGLTGKKLYVNSKWENPTKEYRIGMKAVYEIFPEPLVNRVKAERRAVWDKKHNAVEAVTFRLTPSNDQSKNEQKDIDEKNAYLKSVRDSYVDVGPVVDVISFQDEEGMWRVAIDCEETGDFENFDDPLTTFRAERMYKTWDSKTQLNYAVNIYENGNVVSIVMDSGSHGTHVAGIAAGYHGPDQQELNGVAPGAQIISLKIGDMRLGGMETGTAVIRALTAAAAAGVDLINMSFGEPSRSGGYGRVCELMRQIVVKHHIIFVSSAGNAGPALSTVTSPGGTTPHIIGVGAYVETEMMLAEYAMRQGETPAATHYTWSSRGPTFDGQLGVSISAPGGAIACVPKWTLSGKQLMNGTSMASPNACGGIALILSALKQQGLPRSPARIRRAIESTADVIPNLESFAQGHGLIQVRSAFECATVGKQLYLDIPYDVRVTSRPGFTTSGYAHGVYLREPIEANTAQEHVVDILPIFGTGVDDPDVGFNVEKKINNSELVDFEIRVSLEVTNGGSRWVRVPSVILLNSRAASFKIFVDPTVLPKGSSTFCEVVGYDQEEGKKAGALFRVPISIIRPEVFFESQTPSEKTVSSSPLLYDPVAVFPLFVCEPASIHRKFLQIPPGATWCDIRVVNKAYYPDDRFFVLHCLQVRPQSRFRDDEMEAFVKLGGDIGASINRQVKVWGGGTLEVCIAPYWSAPGQCQVSLEIKFSGVTVNPSVISLGPQNGFVSQVNLRSDLRDVRLEPSGEFTRWISPVSPNKSKSKLAPLYPESRNGVLAAFPPDSRPTWELKLWYEFNNPEKCKLMPKLPLRINDFLYESPFESQLTVIFDSRKKILAVTDYGHTQKDVDVDKGMVTIVCIIRHEKRALLERLKDMNLLVDRTMSSVPLSVHTTSVGPSGGGFKFEPRILKRGFETHAFVTLGAFPLEDFLKKLPSSCKAGDILVGSMTFLRSNKDQVSFGSDDKPEGYQVACVVPVKQAPAAAASGDSPTKITYATTKEEQITIPVLKARLTNLDSIADESLYEAELSDLTEQIENLQTQSVKSELSVSVKLAALRSAHKIFQKQLKEFEADISNQDKIVSAVSLVLARSEEVVASINVPGLERSKLSSKVQLVEGEISEKETTGDMKTRTDALCEALLIKIHCTLDVDATISPSDAPSADLNRTIEELGRWTSETSLNFQQVRLRMFLRANRKGMALQLLTKMIGEDESDLSKLPRPETRSSLFDRQIHILEELEWNHIAELLKQKTLVDQPPDFPLF